MKLYLTLDSIPELRPLPGKERLKIWRCAYFAAMRKPQIWVALALNGVIAGASVLVASTYLSHVMAVVIGSAVGGALGGIFFSQILVHYALPHIRNIVD